MKHLWLIALIVGCGKGHAVDKPNGGSDVATGSGTMMNKPGSGTKAAFVRGIALTPKAAFLTWLDSQKLEGQPRLVRLPIVLPRDGASFDISKARIGTGADALEVYANDSSLGVGLADRAHSACEDTAVTCAFLAEGYWRGTKGPGLEFDVKKAEELPADRVAGVTFAEVEGESGN